MLSELFFLGTVALWTTAHTANDCSGAVCPTAAPECKGDSHHPQLVKAKVEWSGCCFRKESDCSPARITHFSDTIQLGKAPFLEPSTWGAANLQVSLEACQEQCLSIPGCIYGTYITDGPRVKECWLAHQTHNNNSVPCGVGCSSFKKVVDVVPRTFALEEKLMQSMMHTTTDPAPVPAPALVSPSFDKPTPHKNPPHVLTLNPTSRPTRAPTQASWISFDVVLQEWHSGRHTWAKGEKALKTAFSLSLYKLDDALYLPVDNIIISALHIPSYTASVTSECGHWKVCQGSQSPNAVLMNAVFENVPMGQFSRSREVFSDALKSAAESVNITLVSIHAQDLGFTRRKAEVANLKVGIRMMCQNAADVVTFKNAYVSGQIPHALTNFAEISVIMTAPKEATVDTIERKLSNKVFPSLVAEKMEEYAHWASMSSSDFVISRVKRGTGPHRSPDSPTKSPTPGFVIDQEVLEEVLRVGALEKRVKMNGAADTGLGGESNPASKYSFMAEQVSNNAHMIGAVAAVVAGIALLAFNAKSSDSIAVLV